MRRAELGSGAKKRACVGIDKWPYPNVFLLSKDQNWE